MGFKKQGFIRFKNLKNLKSPVYVFILLRNLINKPHIQILIVVCDIHQFHHHFFHAVFFSFAHWRFVF